ncbi:unnamed protein product [Allacma fusca]|uniref:EIF-4F 25 kDa subunit n=1 Tax=Allacma fusca TaxID=39272 RepID=A0A8J2KDK3_9HEXA|nr:unnamed protein product [Allacma fusca]
MIENQVEIEAPKDAKEIATEVTEEQKHHLHKMWKFWYFENNKERNWEDNLRVVSPFDTVEDFWSIYNHIKSASEIRNGCSYFVFKDGLKPMWEDEGNRRGGRWLINFDRKQRQQLDEKWLEVLLCLIGEAFDEDGDDICGAVVDIRGKVDKISVWTADCRNKERILNIGRKIKERLNLEYQASMTYESHSDTQTKTSSSAKHIFVL